MMIDARRVSNSETIETDVCVIGGGPAGITIAQEFLGSDVRVCLLETGGLEPDANIQALAAGAGDTIGDFYPGAIYMRNRLYGGTAHAWNIDMGKGKSPGVRYVTLDDIDFEKRDWIPHSGWPITKATLDPYYERAHAVCKTGPYQYDVDFWADNQAQPLPFQSDRVTTRMFQFGPREVFIHDYRKQIEQSPNITLYLYATVVELETDDLAKTVTKVQVATLEGNRFEVTAKYVILAMGGIENARLLLLSDRVQKSGLGNQHDVVGRYFMDHPLIRTGMFYPANRQVINSLALYDTRWVKDTMVIGKPVLSEAVMRREKLLNINLAMFPRPAIYGLNPLRTLLPQGKRFRSDAVNSAQAIVKALKGKQLPKNLSRHVFNLLTGVDDLIYYQWRKKQHFLHRYGLDTGGWFNVPDREKAFGCFEVFHLSEQAPDPENRVTLGEARDRLGCRQVQIHWRWNDIDIRSTRRAQEIFAEEFARLGLGKLNIELDRGVPQVFLPSTHHNMGSTRMHEDPKQGVVDANCKVHDVSNLYVASCSVFPTGGYANPTLSIIALSIRVADQIKAQLAA